MTRRSGKRDPSGKTGVLPVLGGFLLASAFLRFDGIPIADFIAPMAQAGRAETIEPSRHEEFDALFEEVRAREKELDAREAKLNEKVERLEVGRTELSEQLAAIEEADTELRRLLNIADKAAEDDLGRLALVYENMKPAEAGALFEQMTPAFAAGFVTLMGPAASAQIMATLNPETAYAISVELAGRNVGAIPEQ